MNTRKEIVSGMVSAGLLVTWVLVAGAWGSRYCEESCSVPDDSLRFFLLGDWGGSPIWPYYTMAQKTVAGTVSKMAEGEKSHFQLGLGDNFYLLGVSDEHDHRFKKTFEDVYTASSMQTPWYFIAGNHDHYGNVSGEIAYTKLSQRWVFPSLYYPIRYSLSDGTEVEIVMIDTVSLCGNTRDIRHASFLQYYQATSHEPQGPEDVEAAESQWTWLENTLKASTAKYLIVAGHFPVYSISEHGPTPTLVHRLLPLLQKYKVSAYVSGHDHNLQHLQTESEGWKMNFVVSGGAALLDDSESHVDDVPAGSLKFHYSGNSGILGRVGFTSGGFVRTSINAIQATFDYYSGDGDLLYQFLVPPRN